MVIAPDWGYFPDTAKSRFIFNSTDQEEANKRELEAEEL